MNNKKNIKSVKFINPFKSVIQTNYDIVTKGHGGTLEVVPTYGYIPRQSGGGWLGIYYYFTL